MKRPSLLLYSALLGVFPLACTPGPSGEPQSGVELGGPVDLEHLTISVSGRAELLPEAARLLEAQGQPLPRLEGVPLTLAEPLRLAVSDPGATLGSTALTSEGGFAVHQVPVRDIHLGLAAVLAHEGFVPGATLVFDTARAGSRPRTDILDARAWALPRAFHDVLTTSLGEPRIRALTGDTTGTLDTAGFLLGRVVDGSGAPVAGARVTLDRPELAHRLYYPAADFQSAGQEATSASGLFVYVHSGGDMETFRLAVEGTQAYVPHGAGAMRGLGLVLTLAPGGAPP